MTRHKGIIAYGTELDRQKLAALAQLSGKSGSEFLVEMIREKYSLTLGETDPLRIVLNR
ncbi:hypothetical protein [Mesorhizobium sp. STM 4661]|uniref:hypothetical protein n=1 Tax=Mesorhizobium sp. STM 4661 TaxID=1297570 RepID=UPI0002BF2054|nr:hypothetical protein [Mesorhizobium sp. STM 4661]CCV12918.1 hypothetical protein MESS4_510085 [Mesorhizobium sp. STM 4661]